MTKIKNQLSFLITHSLQEIDDRLSGKKTTETYTNHHQLVKLKQTLHLLEDHKYDIGYYYSNLSGFDHMILDSWALSDRNNKLMSYLLEIARIYNQKREDNSGNL